MVKFKTVQFKLWGCSAIRGVQSSDPIYLPRDILNGELILLYRSRVDNVHMRYQETFIFFDLCYQRLKQGLENST